MIEQQKNNFFRFYQNLKKYYIHNLVSKQISNLDNLHFPLFVIGVPGCLHIIELFMKYIPPSVNVVFITNGMDKWEQKWARDHLNIQSLVSIEKMITHGQILDILFDGLSRPFGILDYDCFIFDTTYYERMQKLTQKSMMNTLLAYQNPIINIQIPETMFIYFNTSIINYLRKKYTVNCRIAKYSKLSERVKNQLSLIGIDEYHYPENYKNYFDTLRLISSLGISEDLNINCLNEISNSLLSSPGFFHVGGVALPEIINDVWQLKGSYFWRRVLEENKDIEIRRLYLKKYGDISPSDLLKKCPEISETISLEFFDRIESIISNNPFR